MTKIEDDLPIVYELKETRRVVVWGFAALAFILTMMLGFEVASYFHLNGIGQALQR